MKYFFSIFMLAALFAVANQNVSGQPLPPDAGWRWESALVWQPAPVVSTVTLAIATPFTIQASPDLKTWYDTAIPAQIVFTVSNVAPQRFYRAVRKQTFWYQLVPGNCQNILSPAIVNLGGVTTNWDSVSMIAWRTDGEPVLQIHSADPLFTVTLPLDVPLLSFWPANDTEGGNMSRFYQLNF